MTLDLAFQIASRLLAFVGLLSLILTQELSFPFWFAAMASVAASFVLLMSGRTFNLSRRTWAAMNLVVLIFFILDLFFISQSLLVASTHFVVFLMVNKLFNLRSPQDHLQLYLISLLQLLAASTFTIDVSFMVAFVLFLLTATWALLLHHLVTESARQSTASLSQGSPMRPSGFSPGVTWPFFLNTNGIAIGALACTLLLFILLPRLGLGFFQRVRSDLIRMSGFSEQVDLGEIGAVKLDSTVVMRVQPSRPLPPQEGIYWRGMVFDHYDGRAWRSSFGSGAARPREMTGVFNLGYRQYPERAMTQEIIQEPLDTSVLFGAPYVIQLTGQFSSIRVNAMGAISLWSVPATRIDYTVTSLTPVLTPQDAETRSVSYPLSIQRFYLQLPERSEPIRRLAEQVAGPAETVFQKVTAIERFLKTNYRYTLDVKPTLSGAPIEDFLFRQKAGFCEHYATAMTLLLRSIGIPARLVTGFLPGEWNEFGKYYTVRQSDAHAWVEVWFPQSGWYPFDPTPPAPSRAASSFWGFLGRSIDSFQWRWNRYVIYYSLRDQIGLVNEVKDDTTKFRLELMSRVTGAFNAVRAFLSSVLHHPILMVLVVLFGGAALFWGVRRLKQSKGRVAAPWRKRLRKPQPHAFYYQMLDLLRAKGYPKPSTLTPQEFLRKIPAPPSPLRPAAAELTDLYYRVRFAGTALSDLEQSRVTELLQNLKSNPTETG